MIWILIVILAAGLILLALVSQAQPKGRGKKRAGRTGNLDKAFVIQRWGVIQGMAAGNGGSLREAVTEADKLLDYALKNSGVRGETMGERLKNSRGRFSNINDIWTAHKLRNALAHEADFDLVPLQAKEAIQYFERGLKDLGAL